MDIHNTDKGLRRAAAIYNFFLFLYPGEYRRVYGPQMRIVFRDIYTEYKQEHGAVGWKFWTGIGSDACLTALRQHLSPYLPKQSAEAAAFALLTFVFTFLLISAAIWVQNNLTMGGGIEIKNRLVEYVQQHRQQILKDVFGSVFTRAQQCVGMADEETQLSCRKETGRMLAIVLREEELADDTGQYWAHDLFFVLRKQDAFYRLGWDGELRDISHEVNRSGVRNRQQFIPLLLRRHCTYFRSAPEVFACEVYESVQLENDSRGYMVRLLPFKAENNFFSVLLIPLLALSGLRDSSSLREFGEEQLYYLVFSFLPIVLSLLVSLLSFFLYKKRIRLR